VEGVDAVVNTESHTGWNQGGLSPKILSDQVPLTVKKVFVGCIKNTENHPLRGYFEQRENGSN
jgi:hypothetical protein